MKTVHSSLSAVDLNLLLAFEALWAERSVTLAGRRLGLSQPAMSGALARLREMLGDPLFIRTRAGLQPTSRCAELAGPLSKALLDIGNALAGVAFDPATTDRQLTLGAVDAAIAVLVPKLASRVTKSAPHAQLIVTAIDPARAVDLVEAGSLDVALSPNVRPSSTVKQRVLFPIELLLAVRPGHKLARGPITRASLSSHPRLQVAFDGAPPGPGMMGIEPAVSVSSFLAVPHLLRESDLWAVLPAPFALKLAAEKMLVARPLPAQIPLPRLIMHMVWPEAQDTAPASRWLRNLIIEETASLRSPRAPG